MQNKYDFIVIGGGVVGLSTAYHLWLHNSKVLVLEKESDIALHQSGRNSGVIHSGIYYKPGSVKSETCREGKELLEAFCLIHEIPFKKCGKVIVANTEKEIKGIDVLYERGKKNGIDCKVIDQRRLARIEPYVRGKLAIHVPETGIVSYKDVCSKLKEYVEVKCFSKVVDIRENSSDVEVDVRYTPKPFRAVASHCVAGETLSAIHVINCSGVYADKIAEKCGLKPDLQIVPFRGEYYTLSEEAKHFCNTLVYPVPNPQFPFLGVHFTSTISGGVECGPNAVLAFGRESYNWYNVNWRELYEILTYGGFWKLIKKHWRAGVNELGMSMFKSKYIRELKKLVPAIELKHLLPRPSGIRAQALDKNGNLIDDFKFMKQGNVLHVLNTPSPAATACLAIGKKIAQNFF